MGRPRRTADPSYLSRLRYCLGVFELDTEVTDTAVHLRAPEQQLESTNITGGLIYELHSHQPAAFVAGIGGEIEKGEVADRRIPPQEGVGFSPVDKSRQEIAFDDH